MKCFEERANVCLGNYIHTLQSSFSLLIHAANLPKKCCNNHENAETRFFPISPSAKMLIRKVEECSVVLIIVKHLMVCTVNDLLGNYKYD